MGGQGGGVVALLGDLDLTNLPGDSTWEWRKTLEERRRRVGRGESGGISSEELGRESHG